MTIWNGSKGTDQKDISYYTKTRHGSLKTWLRREYGGATLLTTRMEWSTKYRQGQEIALLCPIWAPLQHDFLAGCLLLFTGQKREDPDYHSEMNSIVFCEWLEQTLFPKLQSDGAKRVVVLDRAKYHTILTDETRPPLALWNKDPMIEATK